MDREMRDYEVTVETVEQGELVRVMHHENPNDKSKPTGYEWIVPKNKVKHAIDKMTLELDSWLERLNK